MVEGITYSGHVVVGSPDKVDDSGRLVFGNDRHKLGGGASVSDDADALASERHVVPASRVEYLALKVLDTFHSRRLVEGSRKSTHGGDEHVALNGEGNTRSCLHVDSVRGGDVGPDSRDKLRVKLGLLGQLVLFGDTLPVCAERYS